MRLPMEIVEEIYCYLPFEKVIELSKYATKKLYNPEVHTLYWAINNDYLEAFKWLYENSDNEYHKHDCVDYAAWRGNLDITKWLINNDESLLERVSYWSITPGSKEVRKWIRRYQIKKNFENPSIIVLTIVNIAWVVHDIYYNYNWPNTIIFIIIVTILVYII